MKRAACVLALLLVSPCVLAASQSHRSGICELIKHNVDLLLYTDNHHYPTTTCSWTGDRILIKPKSTLSKDRMNSFTFLSFSMVGYLNSEDYKLPEKVFVGYGTDCQFLSRSDAASLQHRAKFGGDLGFQSAMSMAYGAPHVTCPK